MTDWRTIRIPEEDFERHNERRQEIGQTWAEYIDGKEHHTVLELPDDFDPPIPDLGDVDYDRIREIVREETQRAIEEARR